jgi:hypothetical protein
LKFLHFGFYNCRSETLIVGQNAALNDGELALPQQLGIVCNDRPSPEVFLDRRSDRHDFLLLLSIDELLQSWLSGQKLVDVQRITAF